MNILNNINWLNYQFSLPASYILLGIAVYFTIRFKFIQIRALPYFFKLIHDGIKHRKSTKYINAINPFHALFTAMSTSLGMGTIVGPSVAIIMGGPGALLWLVIYSICGSVTKYAEVTFAIHFRQKTKDGSILGGPMQYLNKVHRALGSWYAHATVILFSGWSGLQSNVLAETLAQEGIPEWITGIGLAILVFIMLSGGAKRIGEFNSKLVPIMSVLYVSVSFYILFSDLSALKHALQMMVYYAFSPTPIIGGFVGASIVSALRSGVYKGAYITESGMGTAAIPHSMANVERATDQGILAMTSVYADTFFCLLSGLLVLTTNVWQIDHVSNILMYKVFDSRLPHFGKPLLVSTICMFAFGTMVGNSFNGRQSYASITRYQHMIWYYFFVCTIIFLGSISRVPLAWATIDLLLPLVAIPNVLSLLYLSIKYPEVIKPKI